MHALYAQNEFSPNRLSRRYPLEWFLALILTMLGFLNSQGHNFRCNLRRLGIDLGSISLPISSITNLFCHVKSCYIIFGHV